jgi:hypothetical protein
LLRGKRRIPAAFCSRHGKLLRRGNDSALPAPKGGRRI